MISSVMFLILFLIYIFEYLLLFLVLLKMCQFIFSEKQLLVLLSFCKTAILNTLLGKE